MKSFAIYFTTACLFCTSTFAAGKCPKGWNPSDAVKFCNNLVAEPGSNQAASQGIQKVTVCRFSELNGAITFESGAGTSGSAVFFVGMHMDQKYTTTWWGSSETGFRSLAYDVNEDKFKVQTWKWNPEHPNESLKTDTFNCAE